MPKKPIPPQKPAGGPKRQRSILELDRFSEASLHKWEALSDDLNRLEDVLYFSLEPARRQKRQELIAALQSQTAVNVELTNWVRIVTYQYSNEPLSSAGSLHGYGQRFNAGVELDANTMSPWPALYLAEDHSTAFREKFQLEHDGQVDGLSAQELALETGISHVTVFLRGHVEGIFDMTSHEKLDTVAKVLGRIKLPEEARRIMKRLKIANKDLLMVKTGKQLHDLVTRKNWRVKPVQFGLPAEGHIIAELVRLAGFAGILYQSTKGTGRCLALFPQQLGNGSSVELRDAPPPGVRYPRLSSDTADELAGWDALPVHERARQK